MNDIKNIEFLRTFYCQHILPLVYDESLSYYEQLCKIKAKVNEVIASQNELAENFKNLTKWIDEQLELYAKGQLQEWLDDGTLENIIHSLLNIEQWYSDTATLKQQNLVVGQLVRTISNKENDNYGSEYLISDIKDETTFSVLLDNGLYANMILKNDFYIEQIDEVDLDNILPFVLKSNMNIYLRNRDNLVITYAENKYSNLKNVFIDFTNSTITVKTPYNLTHGSIIQFYNCNNIHINGGEFNGMCSLNLAVNVDTEWCHAFTVLSTNNYEINAMKIHDFCGDGIEVGNMDNDLYVEMDGKIHDLEIYNCHRNGISVLDSGNIDIFNCYIHDIRQLESNPIQQPNATIDFEPFFEKQYYKHININNVKGPNVGGIELWGCKSLNATIENCYDTCLVFRNYIEHETNDFNINVNNCIFYTPTILVSNGVYNLNFNKIANQYRALEINMNDETFEKDYFIKSNINVLGKSSTPTETVKCSKYNENRMSENSYVEIYINTPYANIKGLNDKSVVKSDFCYTTPYSPLFDGYDGSIKVLTYTGNNLTINGKDILRQECTIIFKQNSTFNAINNEIEYTGFTSGSVNSNECLKLIPYIDNGLKIKILKL